MLIAKQVPLNDELVQMRVVFRLFIFSFEIARARKITTANRSYFAVTIVQYPRNE